MRKLRRGRDGVDQEQVVAGERTQLLGIRRAVYMLQFRQTYQVRQRLPISRYSSGGDRTEPKWAERRCTERFRRVEGGEHGLCVLQCQRIVGKRERSDKSAIGGAHFNRLVSRELRWRDRLQKEIEMAILRQIIIVAQMDERGTAAGSDGDTLAEQFHLRTGRCNRHWNIQYAGHLSNERGP